MIILDRHTSYNVYDLSYLFYLKQQRFGDRNLPPSSGIQFGLIDRANPHLCKL
jgi:hypothetical protein